MNENKIKDIAESMAITSQRPLTPYNIERLKKLAIELLAELDK